MSIFSYLFKNSDEKLAATATAATAAVEALKAAIAENQISIDWALSFATKKRDAEKMLQRATWLLESNPNNEAAEIYAEAFRANEALAAYAKVPAITFPTLSNARIAKLEQPIANALEAIKEFLISQHAEAVRKDTAEAAKLGVDPKEYITPVRGMIEEKLKICQSLIDHLPKVTRDELRGGFRPAIEFCLSALDKGSGEKEKQK